MSTEPYVPSDPPTREDWQHLSDRAEVNKRRSRRGLLLGLVSLVLAVAVLVSGAAIYLSQRDVPTVLDRQSTTLDRINALVQHVDADNRQRDSQSKQSSIALGVVLEGIAGGFATPPFPDPGRQLAVEKLCQLAAQFRAAGGDTNPPACPAP